MHPFLHRNRFVSILFVAILLPHTAAADEEQLIGQYDSAAFFGFFGVAESVTMTTFLSQEFGAFSGEGTLFEEIVYQSGDRRLDSLTFGGDPDFERYVELLTDGEDWYLYDMLAFDDGSLNGRFGLESERLPIDPPTDPNDPNDPDLRGPPDLQGFEITRIDRLVNVILKSPGRDVNGDGNWTDVNFDIRTNIYGIPEPSSVILVGAAAACALVRRRRGM